ncbi:MAG: hypothetical protein ACEQSF_01400 [Solirubrobacteraceae bacterium]
MEIFKKVLLKLFLFSSIIGAVQFLVLFYLKQEKQTINLMVFVFMVLITSLGLFSMGLIQKKWPNHIGFAYTYFGLIKIVLVLLILNQFPVLQAKKAIIAFVVNYLFFMFFEMLVLTKEIIKKPQKNDF